jgi:hypothetical protein
MAEVFGIVAGAFGACSLALELLQVTKSVQRCWTRLQDLHSISREISDSLQNIERLLIVIKTLSIQETKDHYVFACLERCKYLLERVKNITQDIEASKATKKLWNIKGSFRRLAFERNLSEARALLRETIDDLSLALLAMQL